MPSTGTALQKVAVQLQVALLVENKSVYLGCDYRLDILVEDRLILELKAADQIERIHDA